MKDHARLRICCAVLCAAAPCLAQDLSATLAEDWRQNAVFRDSIEMTNGSPFVAALPTGAVWRANFRSEWGNLEQIELHCSGEAGAPILRAQLLRSQNTGGVNVFQDASFALAEPAPAGTPRTAIFPDADRCDYSIVIAWAPQASAGAPVPVLGAFPAANTKADRLALARRFLDDPALALRDGTAAQLRPFVLWVGADAVPPDANPLAAFSEASAPCPSMIAFDGLQPCGDGSAAALAESNIVLSAHVRVRLSLRASATSAKPAARQRLRLAAELAFDERDASDDAWREIPSARTRLVRDGRWIARDGGGFELRGDFSPRWQYALSSWENLVWRYWGYAVRPDEPLRAFYLSLSVDAPGPRELNDPACAPEPFAATAALSVVNKDENGSYPMGGKPTLAVRLPLRADLAPAESVGDGAADEPSAEEIRALASGIAALANETSDATTIAAACSNALARALPAFDPSWDPDLELDARRRVTQLARFPFDGAAAYVPWSEMRTWEPADDRHAAFAALRATCLDALFRATGRGADDAVALSALGTTPELARSLRLDAMLLRLHDIARSDALAWQASTDLLCELAAETDSSGELEALYARAVREALAIPVDWDAISTNKWLRDREVQRWQFARTGWLDRGHPDVLPRGATCFRVAEYLSHMPKDAGWTTGVFANGNYRRDVLNSLWHAARDAACRDLLAMAVPFAEDILAVAHIDDPDERKRLNGWIGQADKSIYRREMIRKYREEHPAAVPSAPGHVRLEPYRATPTLQAELDRYGMSTGVASCIPSDPGLHGETNRLSYLLYAPTNAPADAHLPLLLFIPGSGELGPDIARQFRQRGIFEKVCSPDFQARHPCFLLAIAPNKGNTGSMYGSMPGHLPTPDQCFFLNALLAVARAQIGPTVDENRIYGTGLISGSLDLIGLARNFPRFFAAMGTTGTGISNPENDIPEAAPTRRWDFQTRGEWGLSGTKDTDIYYDSLADVIRSNGGELRRTIFKPNGRSVWDRAWDTDEFWDWLFSHRRPAPTARSILRTSDGLFEVIR